MPRVLLIHPGATDYDDQRRIQGTLDVPLNERGSAEVAKLIEELRHTQIDAIYASPAQAAMQTAESLAAAFNLKVKKLEGMENVSLGLWQGMLVEEVRLKQPKVYRQWQENPECICPPEGEMLVQAEERVRNQMSRLLKRCKEGTIALVVPEPLASLVRQFLNQSELGDLWKAADEHGRWEMIEVEPTALASSD
jgi:broad specificity phosphatase PhoE